MVYPRGAVGANIAADIARDVSGMGNLDASDIRNPLLEPEGRLRDPSCSQSLERGLRILACFTPASWVLGVADIAERAGIGRSTAHRYVVTLAALGYLERDAQRKYRLALHVTELLARQSRGAPVPSVGSSQQIEYRCDPSIQRSPSRRR